MCQSLQWKRSKRLKHIKMCNVFIHSFKNYQNHYRTSLMHCIKMGHWHMLKDIVLLIRWYPSINQNTYSFEHQAYLLIYWGYEEVNIKMLFAQMKSPNILNKTVWLFWYNSLFKKINEFLLRFTICKECVWHYLPKQFISFSYIKNPHNIIKILKHHLEVKKRFIY